MGRELVAAGGYLMTEHDMFSQDDQDHGVSTVHMNSLLQLRPKHLEAQVWKSHSAIKLLRTLDYICLSTAVFMSFMLCRSFGTPMTVYQRMQAVLYGVLALLQLLFIHWKPEQYQRLRLKITLVNRLLRLVTIISVAAGSSSEDTRHFHVAVTEQLPQPPGHWAHILRVILGMPLMYFNHANFVLPFAYVLGAQGVTLAAALVQLQKLPCLMTDKPLSMQQSQGLCQGAKLAMHYLGLLSCRLPALAAEAAAAECQGLEGLVLLCLYANLLLLVPVPCLFVYFAELRLKLGFLREQQLTLQHAPPCLESRVGRAVGVYGVLVGSWLACEAAVLFLSPLRCDITGVLVRA